jgi:hypothetical protein
VPETDKNNVSSANRFTFFDCRANVVHINNEHQGPQHTNLRHTQIYTFELGMFSVETRTLHRLFQIAFAPLIFVVPLFSNFRNNKLRSIVSNARLRFKNTALSISFSHCVKTKFNDSHMNVICEVLIVAELECNIFSGQNSSLFIVFGTF